LKGDKEGKIEREDVELQWWSREEGKKRRWSKSDVCMGMPWGRSDRNPHPEDTGKVRNDRSGEGRGK
jgi:hypothetical protein